MTSHRYFSMNFFFFDRCGIQSRLEALALKGWKLESANYFGWRFVRTAPAPIHYAVSYFAKQDQYTSEFDENIMAFNAMCAQRGWNYVTSRSNLRIYCNESPDPIPMDTDPMVELATIHRAAKRSFLPARWVYLCLSVLVLVFTVWALFADPIITLSNNACIFSLPIFLFALVMSALELAAYYLWRSRAKKYAETSGEFLPARSHPLLMRTLAALILLNFIANLFLGGLSRENVNALFRLALILIAGIAAYISREHYKKKGASADENRGSTLAIVIIAVVVVYIVSSVITNQNNFRNFFSDPSPENYGSGYNFEDPLPLYLSDLGIKGLPDAAQSSYFKTSSSFALSHTYYQAGKGAGYQLLIYYIDEVRIPLLYDFILEHWFEREKDFFVPAGYTEISPEPWGVDKAWFSPSLDGDDGVYILCSQNRIITLYLLPDIELTDAQKAIIGEKLSAE